MSGFRGDTHQTLATPARVAVRPITLALVALLIAAILAAGIVLMASGGGDQSGATKSVRVTPSAPIPPSAAERNQPPGLNAPGMRP
jgi:hypothetical protein